MHVPDGILSMPVMVATNSIAITTLGLVWNRIRQVLTQNIIPKVALMAAFLFVAQMINIPILGGTSAHLAGATLAVLLVGPAMGIFVMLVVLTVQMLVFQDGGLFAWGANVLNIAILPVLISYIFLSLYYKIARKSVLYIPLRALSIFITAWFSIQAGALICGLELGLSGLAPLQKIISVMMVVHSVTGILEGILTVLIAELIIANRPDLIFAFFTKSELVHE